jgi:ABC-2 type transport system permease protein
MNIFRFEMRRNFRTFLIWTISIALFVGYMLSVYQTSFAGAGKGMEEFMKMFPESMRKAFGMDRLDLTTLLGYFGTEVHCMILLFGAMYAALLSSSLLSKEENDKTVEFLLARPITRTEMVTQKLMAFVAYVVLFIGATWGTSYVAMEVYVKSVYDARAFWLLGGMTLLAILAVACLGFLGSVFVTRNRAVYSASLGFVLGLYALQIVADISEKARFLRYVTPFKWASAADILPTGKVDAVYLGITVAVIALSVAGSYVAYGRKDITV